MKKREIVKPNVVFNKIINEGIKVSNSMFTIFFVDKTDEKPLFGIAAPKKIGNAVTRNQAKRQTRALVDNNKLLFKNNRNYIIIIKDRFLTSSYLERLESLKTLIGEINEK